MITTNTTVPVSVKTAIVRMCGPAKERNWKIYNLSENTEHIVLKNTYPGPDAKPLEISGRLPPVRKAGYQVTNK